MRDQNIKIIREAAIEANKSILALELGCRIALKDYEAFPNAWGIYVGKEFKPKFDAKRDMVMHPNGEIFPMDEKYEIIGRKVGLADVLLAIGKKNSIKPKLDLYSVELEIGECLWNLLKDSVEDQDDPTLQFLADLLAHKEG